MAAPGRIPRPGLQQPLPGTVHDLEADSKYTKRRRRGGLGLSPALTARAAAAVAAGIGLALLLLAGFSGLQSCLSRSEAQHPEPLEPGGAAARAVRQQPQLNGRPAEAGSGAPTFAASTAPVAAAAAANCSCEPLHLDPTERQQMAAEVAATLAALPHRPSTASVPDAVAAEARGDVVAPGRAVIVPGVQPVRVVDQAFGPQSNENIPGVEDLHAELKAYNEALLAGMTLDEREAAARQHRTTAAELGLLPLDGLNDTASLPHRIAFLNDLHAEVQASVPLHACLVATISSDVWGVRRELLPWLQYHTELGVARFYLLYDGHDAEAVRLLTLVHHITLIHIHPPFASLEEQAKFEAYSRSASDVPTRQWGGQPGNFELMVKQGYGEHEALRLAKQDGMHWLLHLDPDELLHLGGPAFSLPAVLARQPPHVPALRFMNFEGQPEAGDLTNRIEQVTLFRVHKHFITPEAHFWRQKYKLGASAAFLTLYANGKSAVRVDAPGVRHLGPHFFLGDASPRWATPANPTGAWREAVSDDSVVLHYAYSYEQDVAAKAHRSCPDSYLEAARRGDRAKVKECFVIDFDADAYMAAAAGPEAARDFFYSRMVLSEGARVRCHKPGMEFGRQGWCTLANIDRFKFLMEKVGLYRRVQGPQALLRQHERRIQERMQHEVEQRWQGIKAKTTGRGVA